MPRRPQEWRPKTRQKPLVQPVPFPSEPIEATSLPSSFPPRLALICPKNAHRKRKFQNRKSGAMRRNRRRLDHDRGAPSRWSLLLAGFDEGAERVKAFVFSIGTLDWRSMNTVQPASFPPGVSGSGRSIRSTIAYMARTSSTVKKCQGRPARRLPGSGLSYRPARRQAKADAAWEISLRHLAAP